MGILLNYFWGHKDICIICIYVIQIVLTTGKFLQLQLRHFSLNKTYLTGDRYSPIAHIFITKIPLVQNTIDFITCKILLHIMFYIKCRFAFTHACTNQTANNRGQYHNSNNLSLCYIIMQYLALTGSIHLIEIP